MEAGGEAGGPSRSWSDVQHGGTTSSTWGCWESTRRCQRWLLRVANANCHPEVQEVSAAILEQ